MMNSESKTVVYADLWLRIMARFFDLIINLALQVLLFWLASFLDIFGGAGLRWPISVLVFGSGLVNVLYFWLLSSKGRQTPGYRLAGLELQTIDGKPLSTGRALWRSIILVAFMGLWCCATFPVLWALIDKRKRTGHDYICGTQVVTVRAAKTTPLIAAIGLAATLFILTKANLVFPFPLRAYYLPSGSMENTLQMNDRLLVNTQIYRFRAPRNGEIVILKAPVAALINTPTPKADVDFVKRIVGLPGQKVEMVLGNLQVDGKTVSEAYKKPRQGPIHNQPLYDLKIVDGQIYSRDRFTGVDLWMQGEKLLSEKDQERISRAKTEAVPEGQMLVLGDNRSNSNDSHIWGFVPLSSLRGRVMMRYWPLEDYRWFADSDSR